ncbi:MAG: hypothetical protein ACK5OX_07875 [Desertimonas sp.]
MNLDVDLDRFERDAIAFLEANALGRRTNRPGATEALVFVDDLSVEEADRLVEAATSWRRRVYDAGFGWLTGPTEYGGRGLPAVFERRWAELNAQYVTPSEKPLAIGIGHVVPALAEHGTSAAKAAGIGLGLGDSWCVG